MRILQIGKYYSPYKGGFESSLSVLVNEIRKSVTVQLSEEPHHRPGFPAKPFLIAGGIPHDLSLAERENLPYGLVGVLPRGKLLEKGLRVYVLASHTRASMAIERDKNIIIIRLAKFGQLFSQPINLGFWFWIKRIRADLIHLHLPNPLAMFSLLLASPKARLIISYHNDILRPKWAMPALRFFLHQVLDKADAIVVTSDNLIHSSKALTRFKEKCRVIPHGIDLKRFSLNGEVLREAGKIKNKCRKPVILFVGRLVYYKGLKYLLKAMRDIDAELIIVGSGPLKRRLQLLASRYEVTKRVSWAGEVPDGLLPAYYYACDLFVLPSCFNSESFGLVILEAHACGKPLISTNLSTGVTFTNLHQRTGLVVPPKNSGALAEAVNSLLNSRQLREEYGQNGRARAEEEFNKEKMAQKFLTLYNTISKN